MNKTKQIIDDLHHLFGHEVGVSDWKTIDQPKIDAFAFATADASWMHTDPEKTRDESPFGTTIAQSFLVLSCLTDMVAAVELPIPGIVYRQNYGFNRLRILQPVEVGKRIRGRFELNRIKAKGLHGMLLYFDVSIEVEGDDTIPGLIAEWIAYVRVAD